MSARGAEWPADAVRRYRDVLTLAEVGERVGVSTARVLAALRSRGVPRRAPRERWSELPITIEALVFRVALPPHVRRLAVEAKGREGVERLIAEREIGLLWRLR